jgi:hypothetical protein
MCSHAERSDYIVSSLNSGFPDFDITEGVLVVESAWPALDRDA